MSSTVLAKSKGRPAAYGKRFAPFSSAKSGWLHEFELSSESFLYSNEIDTAPAPAGPDTPCLIVGLVPRQRLAAARRRERGDVFRPVAQLVCARCPRRERQQHRIRGGDRESHRHPDSSLRGVGAVDRDVVADAGDRSGDRCGHGGGRCRPLPLNRMNQQQPRASSTAELAYQDGAFESRVGVGTS